jgi:hypothetical protein
VADDYPRHLGFSPYPSGGAEAEKTDNSRGHERD